MVLLWRNDGFTRLAVAVDLNQNAILQIVPDDPVAWKALESRRNVTIRILDPATRKLLTTKFAIRVEDIDPASVCPKGTYGR